jgi:hypothetical protein
MKGFNHTFKLLLVAIMIIANSIPLMAEASTRNRFRQGPVEDTVQIRRIPIQNGSWQMTPTVVICNSSIVDLHDVELAVEWWQERGHEIGQIIINEPGRICHQAGKDGFITIEGPDAKFDFDFLAITHRKSSRDEILSARIQLRGVSERNRILEHEIGHALGWSHCNRRGHIMNPEWSRGGWGDFGLDLESP